MKIRNGIFLITVKDTIYLLNLTPTITEWKTGLLRLVQIIREILRGDSTQCLADFIYILKHCFHCFWMWKVLCDGKTKLLLASMLRLNRKGPMLGDQWRSFVTINLYLLSSEIKMNNSNISKCFIPLHKVLENINNTMCLLAM